MLKKIIFTGLFCAITLISPAQDDGLSDDTPVEIERQYDLLLSRRDINVKSSDENILFDDSVYIKRLHSLPTSMELVFNPAVKAQIELYATRRKRQVSYMLGEGKYYFPIFEAALDREGLPLELKYLPVIESALNPIARSHKAAVGLWQFIPGTGKMYDLEINSLVDERNDPHKSTDAAVRYLKDLYERYGDWNLVIAAYNCGPGNVNKAIRRSGGLTDYWSIYPHLPRETRGYVPIFIAATYIMNYYREHNIHPAESTRPLSMDSVMLNKTLHLQQVADVINIPVEDLRRYNPQYRKDIIPGDYKGYGLNLPMNKLGEFIDKKDEVYAYKASEFLTHRKVAGLDVVGGAPSGSRTITHRVKRGDTLARLAGTYGVTSSQIKQWNNLSSNKLSVGRSLRIYRPAAVQKEALAKNVESASGQNIVSRDTTVTVTSSGITKTVSVPKTTTTYYKIKTGDSWTSIARRNGVSVAELRQWNSSVKANGLVAGKNLKIEKTEYVQVQEIVPLPLPVLPEVILDSTYTADLIDGYLKKIVRDESTLPRIRIASTDEDEDDNSRAKSDDTKIIYHKVKIGETITQIAARYKVSKKDIISWNKLSSNMAKVGQRLLILLPDTDESNASTEGGKKTSYTANK